jgi:hypothetical protein
MYKLFYKNDFDTKVSVSGLNPFRLCDQKLTELWLEILPILFQQAKEGKVCVTIFMHTFCQKKAHISPGKCSLQKSSSMNPFSAKDSS